MDDVLRVACLTLLRHANATLQHIPPLLNRRSSAPALTVGLDDPEGLSGFWQWYDEHEPGAALPGHRPGPGPAAGVPAARLRQTHHAATPRPASTWARSSTAACCSSGSPKACSGEDTTRLLGSLVLAQVWQAATARATVPADQRRDASAVGNGVAAVLVQFTADLHHLA